MITISLCYFGSQQISMGRNMLFQTQRDNFSPIFLLSYIGCFVRNTESVNINYIYCVFILLLPEL